MLYLDLLGFLGVVGIAFLLLMGGVTAATERLAFPGAVAEIEQLREDVQSVDVAEAEDVIGQVVAKNQQIRSYQRYNDIPVISLIVPNGWDEVPLIRLPSR